MLAFYMRDLRLGLRAGGGALIGILFFLAVIAVMPFGVGPDLKLLARIGPAMLWIGALLATLLGLDRLFQADREDGSLDLMLICVESGMSVEAALRRVSDEIGPQSVELAEEFVLTNAELSYLQERRQAYENLAGRTGLESVKSVTQALIQAERYGTPVAHALRVLASESRDMRMNEAEKKAAALPPKLTVPMILFFLPVLFAIILGPAGIQVSQRGIFGDQHNSSEE